MRYKYTGKELSDSYDNAETAIFKAHQRKLLQDHADCSNNEAQYLMVLIEAKDDK